jgi:IS30 family transposase
MQQRVSGKIGLKLREEKKQGQGGELPKRRRYKKFSEEERKYLSVLWNEFGLNRSEIARELKRSWLGIDAELERGYTGEQDAAGHKVYDHKLAILVSKENERKRQINQMETLKRKKEQSGQEQG